MTRTANRHPSARCGIVIQWVAEEKTSGDERPSPIGSPLNVLLKVIRVLSANQRLRSSSLSAKRPLLSDHSLLHVGNLHVAVETGSIGS